ncbi:MAG: PAS domain-containing protein [Magnetococcales bacterium]|nr:PAS domain-containing protein [Magnetococcales bacterium]
MSRGNSQNPHQTVHALTPDSGGQNATFIHRQLDRLGLATPLIVLIAALGVIVPFYLLQARPLAENNTFMQQRQVAERVIHEFNALAGQIDALLLTMRDWTRDERISLDDPESFNGLLIPVIEQHALVSSIHLATDAGRELMLLKTPDGWKNRISHLPKTANRHHWLLWRDARTPSGEEWREQDYDMRRRPWFIGALESTEEEHIHWTPPYQFATTKEPGITASMGWTDPKSGQRYVVAFDILLMDMSRFTNRLKYGHHGQVALLDAEGKVLGLPHHERFQNDEDIRKAVLQKPDALGLTILSAALSRAQGGTEHELLTIQPDSKNNEPWLVGIHRLLIHQQAFRVVTLAPESDAQAVSGHLVAVLFGVMGTIALVAMLAAFGLVNAVRRLIERAFADLEASHVNVEGQTARRTLVAKIAARLQQAHTPVQLAQTLLSEIAVPLNLGQGVLCLWDEESGQLSALARYGGVGQTGEDLAQPLGPLLRQCAVNRVPITLKQPGQDYFRIQSGLGDTLPAAVSILPVEHGGRLFAVLELATFRLLEEADHTLLADLQPIVAMSMDILLRAARTTELLAETTAAVERSRLILEAVNNGIVGLDQDGVITFVNRMALEMLGYREEETIGQPFHFLIHHSHPDGRPLPIEHSQILRTLRDGKPRSREDETFWSKQGESLPVGCSTTTINRNGQVIGAVVVFHFRRGHHFHERAKRLSGLIPTETPSGSQGAP